LEGYRKTILDYSRQQVMGETMELLFVNLADTIGFTERREAFRSGERINTTEGKHMLHHWCLRMPLGYQLQPGNSNGGSGGRGNGGSHRTAATTADVEATLDELHSVRGEIRHFLEQVRTGK
jgi:glucose-6-phosphate isomerase